jgi:hypothetical protein
MSHSELIKEDKEYFSDNSSFISLFKKKRKLFSAIGRIRMKFENKILSVMKNDVEAVKQRYEEKMDLLQTIFLGTNSTHSFKDPLSTSPIFFDNEKEKV